jgi:hypothetical protein
MVFDYGELDNRLTNADGRRECLVCGSDEVDYADKAFLLVEIPSGGTFDLSRSVSGIFCGARVCNVCGHVHLHTDAPVVRR